MASQAQTEQRRETIASGNDARWAETRAASNADGNDQTPSFDPPQRQNPGPSVPAWELQKQDDSIDAAAECRRITQALNDAFRAVGTLRGILYDRISQHGDDYLGFLRQVDAGVYSLSNIDGQVETLSEDVDYVLGLLQTEFGEGQIARSTVDLSEMPTR